MKAINIASSNNRHCSYLLCVFTHQSHQQSFRLNAQQIDVSMIKHTFDDRNYYAMHMYAMKSVTFLEYLTEYVSTFLSIVQTDIK